MPLENRIIFRNEYTQTHVEFKIPILPPTEILTNEMNQKAYFTHKSKLRGQLTCKGGLAIDDLIKILDCEYQLLLNRVTSS